MDRQAEVLRTLERLERSIERGPDRSVRRPRPSKHVEVQPISREQEAALRHIGTFRSVEKSEVDAKVAEQLIERGMIRKLNYYLPRNGDYLEVLTLTKSGRASVESIRPKEDKQHYFTGTGRPVELEHDLAIPVAVRKEREAIERNGGEVLRIKTDYEFRAAIMSEKRIGSDRRGIAESLEIPIVNDRMMIPDARIEYRDQDGNQKYIDVEVTTRSYRAAGRSAKRAAGFKIHATKQRGKAPYEE